MDFHVFFIFKIDLEAIIFTFPLLLYPCYWPVGIKKKLYILLAATTFFTIRQ